MKIAVIGTGYVGLVSGVGFAEIGHEVWCVDNNEDKIRLLEDGTSPIYEKNLQELLVANLQQKRLHFTTELPRAIETAGLIFIAVGTPMSETGEADIRAVIQVAEEIGRSMNDDKVIVVKSTVPVGTNKLVKDHIQAQLDKRQVSHRADMVSNPEFLREGSAVDDFLRPDRIVVGTDSQESQKVMERLYAPFVKNGHPLIFMDTASAEITKYAANAMLATKISFMNEMARLCESVGADITHVRKGVGSDPRIGFDFLYAGMGYGGCCLPKDVKALSSTGKAHGAEMSLITRADEINKEQKTWFTKKIMNHFNQVEGKTFAMWGLAFKPGTDDIREAPALEMIETLSKAGARITAYDPKALQNARDAFQSNDKVRLVETPYEALKQADALILATEWREFLEPDFTKIKSLLKAPVIFDGRNQYSPSELKTFGFDYISVGR